MRIVKFVVVILGIATTSMLQAQKFEGGINFTLQTFDRVEVEVVNAINIFNYSASIYNNKQLPLLTLSSKNITAPAIWVKYKEDSDSPFSFGGEVILKGLNVSVFFEYSRLLHKFKGKVPVSIFARPRAGIGWNNSFSVSPDWKTYLATNMPFISTMKVEEGNGLFSAVSPTSLGYSLNVLITPELDVEYSPFDSDSFVLRGVLRYNWDLMTLLSSRSQNGLGFSIGAVYIFGD